MVEPPATPHRERWLHVVRDGEPAPGEDATEVDAEERRGTRLPPVVTRNPPAAPEPHSGDWAAPDPNPTAPAPPSHPDPAPAGAPGAPAGERRPSPGVGPDNASSGTPARKPPSEPDSGKAGGYGSLAGPPTAPQPSLPGAGVGPPRAVSPHQPGPYLTAGYRPAPYGTSPAPPAPRPGGGGGVQAPPRPASADRAGGGRWLIVRAGSGRWQRRVGWAWAGAAVGTAVATVVDRVVGGLDGRPALFLLVVLALPFWDGLPARVTARLAEVVAVVAVVAVLWFGLAAVRPEGWWRAEIAYGIACGVAGTAHALLSRRRTVEP